MHEGSTVGYLQCQIWFRGESEPWLARASIDSNFLYRKHPKPFLLDCPLPENFPKNTPASVSLVIGHCVKATNNLRVVFNKLEKNETKKDFAVCVKGLSFPKDDLSVRLIEWIEVIKALGADQIFSNLLEVHPNVTKVLDYYSSTGFVDISPITLPGRQPNNPLLQTLFLKNKVMNKRQFEILLYNDCLYRNMYRFKYIAVLDTDEVIVPKKHNSWSAMMKEVVEASALEPKTISWHFRHVYFIDRMTKEHHNKMIKEQYGIPEYMYMMNKIVRSANHSIGKDYTKSFIDPEKALVIFNHQPLASLEGKDDWTSYEVTI